MEQKQKNNINKKYIYIFNFGDYFARLTAKKIKQLGGRPRIVSFNTPFSDLTESAGFILSGSPNGSIRIPIKLLTKELFATNYPIMGICVGAHLITRYFGGKYKNLKKQSENGIVMFHIDKRNKLLRGLNKNEEVVMMHQDSIIDPGEDFKIVAHTDKCQIAATSHKKWRWYTFQFHPELSPCGNKIFENFLNLCYRDKPESKPRKEDIIFYTKKGEKVEASLPDIE